MTRHLLRCAGPMGLGLTLFALMVAAPASARDGDDLRALAERLRAGEALIPAADGPAEAAAPDAGAPPDGDLARLQALAERAGSWTRDRPPPGFSAADRLGTDQDRFEALFPVPEPGTPLPAVIPGVDLPPCGPSSDAPPPASQ